MDGGDNGLAASSYPGPTRARRHSWWQRVLQFVSPPTEDALSPEVLMSDVDSRRVGFPVVLPSPGQEEPCSSQEEVEPLPSSQEEMCSTLTDDTSSSTLSSQSSQKTVETQHSSDEECSLDEVDAPALLNPPQPSTSTESEAQL